MMLKHLNEVACAAVSAFFCYLIDGIILRGKKRQCMLQTDMLQIFYRCECVIFFEFVPQM